MDQDLFESVKPRRLSDSAVDQILGLVNAGQLAPGSRMPPERELITRLGVSRTSLREAIRILETLGVLRVVPGRGTWVREDYQQPKLGETIAWLPSHEHDVMQLFEVRETLEVKAAQLAAERATADELVSMSVSIQRLQEAIAAGDYDGMLAADSMFHEALGAASGNALLVELLGHVYSMVQRVRKALIAMPGRPEAILREHISVMEAILSRNARLAAKAIQTHDRKAEEAARAAIAAGHLVAVTDKSSRG
ncbi:MAG: FadR family transcriptional regulator [Actinobacteria bacterium]|nr:FadR family transcriptional regulator [Actinomycetota bacterium]OPZ78002.1 MAG: putative L-lactate dehydrogenase operon regulatory protein [Actinobacteria bacterium ADurb.Bin444]